MPLTHGGRILVVAALLMGLCGTGGCGGCTREEQAPPPTTKGPAISAQKGKNDTNPPAVNAPVAQENTVKYYLVSANKAKTILSQIKDAGDVDDAVFKLQKEGDNVKSLINQLNREGTPPQPLSQYAAELATTMKAVREAGDPRHLPEALPKDKRDALRAATARFFDLMREFNRAAEKHKVIAGGS